MNKKKVSFYCGKWNFGEEERIGKIPSTPSKYLEYVTESTDVGIWLDYDGILGSLETEVNNSSHKYKVLVLQEPMSFNRALSVWITNNEHLFDMIFVHYPAWKGLGESPNKWKYYKSIGKTFISSNDRKIYPKTKNITAVWSSKNMGLEGHMLRINSRDFIRKNIPSKVDFNNPVEKVDGLKDYRYEIVVENEFPFFISEKPLDAMLSGCIPIIWGDGLSPQWEGFDKDGMLFFKNEEELYTLLKSNKLNKDFYDSKLTAIKHNFLEAQKYISLGDQIWEAGLKDLVI